MNNGVAAPVQTAESHRLRHSHRVMHLLMLLATFCWAANIIAAKEALTGFSAMALAALRIAGAALLFALLFLARGKPLGFPLRRSVL